MMRRILVWSGRLFLVLAAGIALSALVLREPPLEIDARFDADLIGPDVSGYLARAEAAFADIRPGAEKRVHWVGAENERTPLAVLYVHGFSASAEEIRPVPDRVAEALGANLVFTRLTGHGRTGEAMAGASLDDWMRDMAEAMAVARAAGDEVIVMSTSTGSTLATIAARNPDISRGIKGHVFVSPNFGLRAPASMILTWPLVRFWGPIVAGPERSFTPHNEAHGAHWTTRYPTVALIPMAQAVRHARQLPHHEIGVPLLVMFSEADQIVSPDATRAVASRWGGPVTRHVVRLGPGDDPVAHVIAGDILSPGQTDRAVSVILDWARGL